ncbi:MULTISPECIES: HNH endonuclease [unclassified Brevundimonas]|uniref:HNH endonuclease n=1 Tax=unclassified Brevundimonas TaxID=2622653 RepID=UPI0018EA3037|nr:MULTISPECIES: HNH endonuclease [unclassified Brevundimonas]
MPISEGAIDLKKLSVPAVKRAIEESKREGRDVFRKKHGFHISRRYYLKFEGEYFDTKPIVGVAFKHVPDVGRVLKPTEFSGGIATPFSAGSLLDALGFEVVETQPGEWEHLISPQPLVHDDKIDDDWLDHEEVSEGTPVLKAHLRRERRSADLAKKLKLSTLKRTGRLACVVCEFDFAATYGPKGLGYIEAHHIVPLGESDEAVITMAADLALVCANCHRMVHRSGGMTLDDLRVARREAFEGSSRSLK